jgi:hypothetical protein
MKKMINKSMIEGVLLEKELRSGVTKAGVPYVSGRLQIETEPGNVITIDVFEQQKTSKGLDNAKFGILNGIYLNGSAKQDGATNPTRLRVNSALDLNDWTDKDGQPRTALINAGGYINIVSAANPKAEFETDIVIKSVQPEIRNEVETGRAVINGLIFNYRNNALPVRLIVENKKGVDFFSNLDPNTFTRVWGVQVNNTVTNEKAEESAFGDSKVVRSSYTRKELVVTGAQTIPYEEDQLTPAELAAAVQARNILVAEKTQGVKPAAPTTTTTTAKPATNTFNF